MSSKMSNFKIPNNKSWLNPLKRFSIKIHENITKIEQRKIIIEVSTKKELKTAFVAIQAASKGRKHKKSEKDKKSQKIRKFSVFILHIAKYFSFPFLRSTQWTAAPAIAPTFQFYWTFSSLPPRTSKMAF